MRRRFGCLGAVLLLLAPVVASAATRTDASADLERPGELRAFVDALVPPLMENNNSPSGAVAIMKDGELVLARGYGWQNIERRIPVDPYRTLFRPGSVSKLFTWVAVMQQVEQGRLDLDTDVNTWLEHFRIADTFERPVTLRDLMTHTPGFDDGGMGYLIIDDAERALPLAEAMARYQPARVNPPGTFTAYSNYGTALAGLIVSNVTGTPYIEYVREHILVPLGMRDSTFEEPLPAALKNQMAASYAAAGGGYVEQPFEIIISFAPAGAMSASVTDLARFGQAILNGGELDGRRILRPESVEAMLTRQFAQDDRLNGMGLGFYENERNGIRLLGHDGDTAWFHSELILDPAHSLVVFVSFGGGGGGVVRSTFKNAFYDRFFPNDEMPPVPPPDFASRAGKYVGEYWFWRSNFSTIEKAFSMADAFHVEATADDTLRLVIGADSKQYVEVETNLFRELDGDYTLGGGFRPRLLAFQQDSAGTITGFTMDEWPFMSLRKKPWYERLLFMQPLLWFCGGVFVATLLLRLMRRRAIGLLPRTDRRAIDAAVWAAASHLTVGVAAAWVLHFVAGQLRNEVPFSFKFALVLPLIATVLTAYLVYHAIGVWSGPRLGGRTVRLAHALVSFCALFMCWFYAYWNILGFQLP
ncbi:serine hydrolase domain-containing protein [Elongatibacter sediminis]|uniref:Serine hydrolase domain-containing protein n=1 Tax=Elongatibacter sediminis TaxID=3119006 RepID=A0AAW9RDH9_9GAMM